MSAGPGAGRRCENEFPALKMLVFQQVQAEQECWGCLFVPEGGRRLPWPDAEDNKVARASEPDY